MIKLELGALIVGASVAIARIKVVLGWIGQKWTQIAPIALPLIVEAERLATDGKIDRADRKQLVMKGLQAAQDKGLMKLNWIEKMLLPLAVDKIAEALPDITISQQAQAILADIISKQSS